MTLARQPQTTKNQTAKTHNKTTENNRSKNNLHKGCIIASKNINLKKVAKPSFQAHDAKGLVRPSKRSEEMKKNRALERQKRRKTRETDN